MYLMIQSEKGKDFISVVMWKDVVMKGGGSEKCVVAVTVKNDNKG